MPEAAVVCELRLAVQQDITDEASRGYLVAAQDGRAWVGAQLGQCGRRSVGDGVQHLRHPCRARL